MKGHTLADWLTLREPYDAAARSESLVRVAADALPRHRPVRIVDLGAGRGSNVRYLTGRLPQPQHWVLVDEDPVVLDDVPWAMAGILRPPSAIETRELSLGVLDGGLFEGCHLVTASALLDLVSESWLESLADRCVAISAVGLFALTYNGESQCSPVEPEDEEIRKLMNCHQRTNDKGFGRAAGPDAVDVAERCFSERGYRVQRARSDWNLSSDARELQRQLVDGWAEAASEIAPEFSTAIVSWHQRRRAHIDAARSQIIVCHEDLVALPPRP